MEKSKGDTRVEFIKARFKDYYEKASLPEPSKLQQREFGVITERGGMWRHLGFKDISELQTFLTRQAPLHAYHSSAYYKTPNARTMDEKSWLGADLIFDLDADHIPGTENMTLEEMLAAVKVQFIKLIDSYLLGDFGFEERDLKIVFSGGRGYHAHISSGKVIGLDSHERREIVDYITNPNPAIENLLHDAPFDQAEFKGHVKLSRIYRLHPPDTPGWKGKLTRSVFDFLDRTEKLTMEEILDELSSFKGIGDKLAGQIYESLYLGKPGRRGIDKIRELNLEAFSDDKTRNSFINIVLKAQTVELGGETDEPVTSDIKRLIRLPGSLHGKTGLLVRTLDVDTLKGFEPLRDSVIPSKGTVKVQGNADHEVSLGGEAFSVKEGREQVLPVHAALFFACQKKCDIII